MPDAQSDKLARMEAGTTHSDPLSELRERHRYLSERQSRVFPIPGFQGKLGVRLRVLDDEEMREISEQTVRLRREGVENFELIDYTDTLLRATEMLLWRTSKDAEWKGLHEYPGSGTESPIKFDARLAAILDAEENIDRSEGAEAESRQVLWLTWADTWRVRLSHEDYMMWRTLADEDAADEVEDELRAEVEGEVPPGEAVGAT